ncbi:nuclear hormone receptor FTZ-F1 isoform X1 [Teleopsis dalmanni]|uniref:nuclear hormone receptor FTZ-F1 isoform X1 n=1 Tax=Teleopsis dalmanni TaxID=139649 RepID=UPI0018CD91D9|nr:nuclear hormone receptor FTZ-F1 isoform X1 [Teleopsis dalmanni]
MDDFNVPIMTNNGFNTNSNSHSHHHKDHMLGGRSTLSTPFMYDVTNRIEISTPKSDYAAFANCIQQSALLDHRAVDSNIDGVSLSGLCDLKFGSSSLTTDTSFKNLSLINTIEANHVMITKHQTANVGNDSNNINTESTPSFTDLFQLPRHPDPKVIQNCEQPTQAHYLNLKPTESAEVSYLQNTITTTAATHRNCEPPIMGFSNNIITTTANIGHKPDTQTLPTSNNSTANATGNTNSVYQICSKLVQFDNLQINSVECLPTTNQTENQISTTTTITSTANKIIDNNNANLSTSRSNMQTFEELSVNPRPTVNTSSSSSSSKASQEEFVLNHHHISPVGSSDSDSVSSSEEFIDMEIGERAAGYQDNTSSHSHQSANGGGGNAGGGGGANTSNQAVGLLNGSVGGNANSAGGYMTLLPPAVGNASGHHLGGTAGTSASSGVNSDGSIDFKHLFEELCPVCGDKVSGYHYGLLTCESCKGFFKRTVQNKKVYTCVAERSCHIDKTQRKRCPYCRFQKCLEVGMKLEAVRADRMRGGRNKFGPMYKRDRARKLQVMRQRQLALQALRTSISSADMKQSPLSPGYQQAYPNMNIKQEIQIPQISSLTQSPDSSPSPIAIALGQVNASAGVISAPINNSGAGGGGGGGSNNTNNNSNNTSDGLNRGGNGSCHDTGTGSLQNTGDSKLCFDSGTHPSSTADSIIEPLRVSPMIREFVQSIDDREWQTQLFALLQKQTYNQVEVDLFELMCKVLDQNLFSQVDWARNTIFFKDLKVDDQMKLLQHSWSDMLVLDHLHQRIHNALPDETLLNNGQVFNLLGLGLLGVPQLADYFNELQNKLQDLKFDMGDYVCMKFLILLNPDVRGIINKKTVLEGHENVQAALLDYTLTCYPSVTDKFRRLLNILPDIHAMAARGEEHLYSKHCAGSAPTQTLLMEMLHAKRKV